MSIGLGKYYSVRLLKHHVGDLNSCLAFMEANKPCSNKYFFELRPLVDLKNRICDKYMCDLVVIDFVGKRL